MPVPAEKIIELAKKAGFETELKVASILASARWRVDQSVYYIDKDENQGRELDIYAYRVFHQKTEDKPEVHCLINFCIEVKKTSEPFIFFTSKMRDVEPGAGFSIMHWRHNIDSNALDYRDIERRPLGRPDRIARSYVAFKDGKAQQIRSGVLSAVKATVHYTEKCNEKWSDVSRDICFFIPVLVVDGPLYECFFDEYDEMVAQETDAIVFLQNYLSPEYGRIAQRVHIFTPAALQAALKKFERWGETIIEKLAASRNRMVQGGVAATVKLLND